MENLTLEQKKDYLIEMLGISLETIKIVTAINGNNEDTYNDILYAVSGYRNFEQLED